MDTLLTIDPQTQIFSVNNDTPTISVIWDKVVQQAVINTRPGPTVASRAYAILHTAMHDAWAQYDTRAIATLAGDEYQRTDAENTEANKTQAMSYAAYRVLLDLFPTQAALFDAQMEELGLDPGNSSTDTRTAAGIGNVIAEELMEFRRHDGSNQLGTDEGGNGTPYSDTSGYIPVNTADHIADITRWTSERVPIDAIPGEEIRTQRYLTPHWGGVDPFGLELGDQFRPDAPEPFLLVEGATVDLQHKTITLADGTVLHIDKSLIGTVINPGFIEQAEEVIEFSANLTDEQKLVSEVWENGGGTPFPPGTWMTFGQLVSARDEHTLDQDAKMFFALSNALMDAGIATWEAKGFYDYTRPVRAIRTLGELGLIGEYDDQLGGYAIHAWGGPGLGTQRILASDFITYQTPGADPSPPFAEFTSGHSAFSAAGAEILKRFTGSDFFGQSITFAPGTSRFETGLTPGTSLTLAWDTFTEASNEAGISRRYGGIHFEDGDLDGRTLGRNVADSVFTRAQYFSNAGETPSNISSPTKGIFTIEGLIASNIQFNLILNQTRRVTEISVFEVDDDAGSIDGIAVGAAGYLAAALGRGRTVLSTLAAGSLPDGFGSDTISRILGKVQPGRKFGFFLIEDSSIAQVRTELSQTGSTQTNIFFSTSNNFSVSTLGSATRVAWTESGSELAAFSFQATSQTAIIGTSAQEQQGRKLIDLSSFTGQQVEARFQVNREAAFNNYVGFYRVFDSDGGIDVDDDGIVDFLPGDQGYALAAVRSRVQGIDLRVANQATARFTGSLDGGFIFAPFLIVNGTVEQVLSGQSRDIFFSYLGANSDRVDHVRLLGDNTFGFEDIRGGGDRDFQDVTVKIELNIA